MVRQPKKAGDQRLVDREAKLVFDDAAQRLKVESTRDSLDATYVDVTKVIFEQTEHMRGCNEGAFWTNVATTLVPGGGLAAMAVAAHRVTDYLCYLEIRQKDGSSVPYVMEVGKDSIEAAKVKLNAWFAGRTVDPPEATGQELDRKQLKELGSKHRAKAMKQPRAMPEVQPDKALVVMVARTPSARLAGKGTQIKLHANDRMADVNTNGTWAFAYLDPGEYSLVAQAGNASGLQMTLEACREY